MLLPMYLIYILLVLVSECVDVRNAADIYNVFMPRPHIISSQTLSRLELLIEAVIAAYRGTDTWSCGSRAQILA